MAGNDGRPDPMELLQQLFSGLLGGQDPRAAAQDVWARATEPKAPKEPSAEQQRENLTFALATRAVEALEDLALNVAAIRQQLGESKPKVRSYTDRPSGD